MIEGSVLFRSVLLFRMTEGGLGGIADRLARSNLSFFFTILRHHRSLGYGNVLSSIAIKTAIPNVDLQDICSSPAVRSLFNGRLQNAHNFGQSAGCNFRVRLDYRKN